MDCDCGLNRERGEQGAVIGRKLIAIAAQDEDQADDFPPRDHRQADAGQQTE